MPAKSVGLTKPKKLPKASKVTRGGLSDTAMAGGAKPPGVTNQPTSTIIPRTNEPPPATSVGNASTPLSTATGGGVGGSAMPGGYTPWGYNAVFWEHPEALAQDYLSTNRGINNPQMTNEFAPTVDALQLLTAFLGADAVGELLDASGQANQMNDYMNQITTPGGQALDPAAIMMALANADPNSASGLALSGMTPEQVSAMAMQLVSAAGGNPFQMRGIQAGLDQGMRDYEVNTAKMGQGEASIQRPYWQGLQQGPLGGFFGG